MTSVDISDAAIERVLGHCRGFPTHRAFQWNLVEPLNTEQRFDLVLALGVVHHTGDAQNVIKHLAAMLKPGGSLVAMVYGYPRLDHPGDFRYMCTKERRRQAIRHMDFDEVQQYLLDELGDPMKVRGWFDATTPRVEDHFTYPQVALMLERAGLTDLVRLAPEIRNLCVRGRKP